MRSAKNYGHGATTRGFRTEHHESEYPQQTASCYVSSTGIHSTDSNRFDPVAEPRRHRGPFRAREHRAPRLHSQEIETDFIASLGSSSNSCTMDLYQSGRRRPPSL